MSLATSGRALLAAGLTTVAACTIEDASDKRAADSAAAATAISGGVRTSSSPGALGPSNGPAAAADSAVAEPGAPGAGNLSPDSVDVGRTAKGALLPLARTRIEVDVNAKQLHVFDGDTRVGTYRVAVGSTEWPTKTGEWSITQVVWNPEWIPPRDESWAKASDRKDPGAPDNPLGRAQLVYDPPRTIHGTNEPQSIGKAVSHGSIRMANADVVKLARQLMEVAGVHREDDFYRQVQQNRAEKVVVDLPQRVAIRVF